MNIIQIKKIIQKDINDCNKFIENKTEFEEYERGFKDGLKNVLTYLNKIK